MFHVVNVIQIVRRGITITGGGGGGGGIIIRDCHNLLFVPLLGSVVVVRLALLRGRPGRRGGRFQRRRPLRIQLALDDAGQ